jgi:hypothetical protein
LAGKILRINRAAIAASCASWREAGSCKAGRSCELAARIGRELAAVELILNTAERIYIGERVADRVADPAGEAIRYGTAGSSAAQQRSCCGYGEQTLRC